MKLSNKCTYYKDKLTVEKVIFKIFIYFEYDIKKILKIKKFQNLTKQLLELIENKKALS